MTRAQRPGSQEIGQRQRDTIGRTTARAALSARFERFQRASGSLNVRRIDMFRHIACSSNLPISGVA
eukprot:648875-Alexandrium_andersonii.AAC.1